jgi:hypothetical protein
VIRSFVLPDAVGAAAYFVGEISIVAPIYKETHYATGIHRYICFLGLVFSAAERVQAKPHKSDSHADISQTLQAIKRAWLNAEKNHDVAAFGNQWSTTGPPSPLMASPRLRPRGPAEIKSSDWGSVTMGEMEVRVFGDAAVVTGSDDETTIKAGKKSTDHYA